MSNLNSHSFSQEEGSAKLELLMGEGKGTIYPITDLGMSIGRSEDNDVVIQSGSVSRHHARVEINADGSIRISDQGSKNGIQINGETLRDAELQHGDVIQIGEFAFRFTLSVSQVSQPTMEPPSHAQMDLALTDEPQSGVGMAAGEPGLPSQTPDMGMGMADFQPNKKVKVKVPSKRPLIYGVVGLLLAGLYFFSESETPGTAPEDTQAAATNGTVLDKMGETAKRPAFRSGGGKANVSGLEDPLLSAAEHQIKKFNYRNPNALQAEQYFRKGRREYLNKSFHRAIQDFSTALSFDRKHYLSEIYLRLAVADAEAQAKTHLQKAVTYYENLQYKRSIYHFRQVIDLMQHKPNHEIIKQSKRYIKAGTELLRGAELFP